MAMTPRFKQGWICNKCVLVGQTKRMDVWVCDSDSDIVTLTKINDEGTGYSEKEARKYAPVNSIIVSAKLRGVIRIE